MSAQWENHFNKVLAYLSSTGDRDVMSHGTLGYSSSDNTLRLHDGCTKGGRWKLALEARCVDATGTQVDPKTVVKGAVKTLFHGEIATVVTAERIGKVELKFTANWPDAGGEIEVSKLMNEAEPNIVKEIGNVTYVKNFADEINEVFGQYGLQAVAMPDSLQQQGRIAVRGPEPLGAWKLEMKDSTGAVTSVEQK